MRPGWVLLRRCRLDGGDGDGAPPPRVRFALLHADVGVALLDLAPELTPDAAARLRRNLDAARFGAAFPGHLPIVHCVVPADRLHRFGEVLDSAFAMEAPLTLRKGYAWVGFVRRVLEADDAAGGQDSQSRHDGELPRVRPAAAPPAAGSLVRRRLPGLPALFSLWALLLATFGAGVAVLQSIGPPAAVAPTPRPEPSAPTAAAVPAPPPRSVLPDAGSLAAAADPHLAHPTSHVATGAETPREPAPTALGGGGLAEAMTPLTAGERRTADDAWSAEASASPAGPDLATTPPSPIAEPARAAVPAPAAVAEAPASDVGADAFEEAIASVEPSEGGFQIPAPIPVANGPPAAGDDNATAPSFASATDGPPLRHAPGTADLPASAPTAGAGVPDATTDPPRHAPHVPRAEIPHAAEAVQAGPPAPQRERVASAAAGQGANASVPPSVVAGLPLRPAPPPPPPAAGAKRAPQAAPPWRQAAAGADRPAVATDTPARPAWPLDQRCRDILIRALLGEKPSDASRSYLRAGCGARD